MRHRKQGRALGRNCTHRKALLRNLVTSFLEHGQIQTTVAKAKELRRLAEHLITIAKKALRSKLPSDLSDEAFEAKRVHALRLLLKTLYSKDVSRKVLNEYAPRFENRVGGYTQIFKLSTTRHGDDAPVSLIRLTTTD